MGEGAGVALAEVLEELEHAKARGAKILGEVVARIWCNRRCLPHYILQEDGSGAAKAMEWAVKEAGISQMMYGM